MNPTRRDFLRTAVATAMATAAAPSARAQSTFKLDYNLASSLYGTLPLKDILPEVAKIGATTIDIWPRKHGSQREELDAMGEDAFQTLLAEHNVTLGMITRYDLGPFKLQDEIPLAGRLGARIIIAGSKGYKGDPAGLKDAVRQFVEQMKPHADAAEAAGAVLGIENHANALIHEPDSLRYLAEFATSPALAIAFAPYHLPQAPSLQAQLIRDIGPKLCHFYAWEHGYGSHEPMPKAREMQQLPGFGQLDFVPILQALKDIGYTGWTSVFMHPTPRGIPILPEIPACTEALNRSKEYLEHCLTKLK
jgi:sugar phosphate isomerase/epimerase